MKTYASVRPFKSLRWLTVIEPNRRRKENRQLSDVPPKKVRLYSVAVQSYDTIFIRLKDEACMLLG